LGTLSLSLHADASDCPSFKVVRVAMSVSAC
jgi:hypothetical protein